MPLNVVWTAGEQNPLLGEDVMKAQLTEIKHGAFPLLSQSCLKKPQNKTKHPHMHTDWLHLYPHVHTAFQVGSTPASLVHSKSQ